MKFIGPVLGRCIYLFAWEEVRPPHGESFALLARSLVDRYHFLIPPDPPKREQTAPIPFREGFAVVDDQPIALSKLEIYSDGFAVDCLNTDDAGKVAEDLIKWCQSTLGYRDFFRPPQKVFGCQIVVEFEREIGEILKKFGKLQSALSGPIQERYGVNSLVGLQRIEWKCDPHTTVNASIFTDYVIERRAGEPYTSNRFFCSAPLPTSEAVSVFEMVEKSFAD
jgi:hypothetical protein